MVITQVKKLLPKSANVWIVWILVAIGLVIAYRMIMKEIRLIKARTKQSQVTANEQILTEQLSYTPAEFSILAERFRGAFRQLVGYNFDTVEAVLKTLKTASDFYNLIKVYGVRDISILSWYNQEFSLIECLEDQLSDSDLKKVSKILSNINVTF